MSESNRESRSDRSASEYLESKKLVSQPTTVDPETEAYDSADVAGGVLHANSFCRNPHICTRISCLVAICDFSFASLSLVHAGGHGLAQYRPL